MSLFDSALATASDTAVIQAGGQSFADQATDVIQYGVGAAVLSGLGSIYNTGAAGINLLGGSVEEIDTYKKLAEIDLNWADYYKTNKNAIDTVGFIGSSFIPGTLAIKGLNLARAGSGAGAFGRALGFARTAQAEALDAALVELAAEGGTVFTRINKNKLAAMAWGTADQTLSAAAFETGVALTMKQSPLLADDSWWDIGKTAMLGAAFGGLVGGGIDSLILNKSFKNAVSAIDSKQRKYDYVAGLDKFSLDVGDKAYALADSLIALPREVLTADKTLELSFHLAAGSAVRKVDISKVLGNVIQGTERKALQDFEITLQQLSNDSSVTQSFADFALKRFVKMRDSGASDAAMRDSMGDVLFELKAVRAATEEPTVASQDLWYFRKSLKTEELAGIKSIEDWETAIKSSTPFADNAYKKPYVFLGSQEQKLASFKNAGFIGREGDNGFKNLSEAWKAGRDVAFLEDGTLRVNDSSNLWKRVDDPIYSSSRYLNTRTGAITENSVLTAADKLAPNKVLDSSVLKLDAVYLPTKSGTRVLDMKVFNEAGDTEYFTARHAWASKLTDEQIPTTIEATDFSLMDRLRTVASEDQLAQIDLYSGKHFLGTAADVGLDDTIRSAKLSESQRLFMEAAESGKSADVRAVAYQLNVEPQWLEQAVASRFRDNMAGELQVGNKTVSTGDGIFLPLDTYTRRENLVVEFSRPQQFRELDFISPEMSWQQKRNLILESVDGNGGQFVTGEQAWAYRVNAAIQINKNAGSAVLGLKRTSLLLDLAQDAAKMADSSGVGATMFGSSNADYGNYLKLWAQDTGKNVHKWIQDDVNTAVTAMGTAAMKLRAEPVAASELGILTNLLRSSDEKYVWSSLSPKQMILRELKEVEGDPVKYAEALRSVQGNGRRPTIDVESDLVVDFLKTHTSLNSDRINKRTVLNNAKGFQSNINPDTVYVPPIDTTYFQHFAFVRPIEGKAFGTSEVSMIFGRNAEELGKRLSSVDRQNFDVVTKQETEKFFKAKQVYDFDLTINEPRINSELRKSGALSNFQPEVRPENLIEDYIRWHQNQAGRLVRDSVETYYAQQFQEISKLGENYVDVASSQFAGTIRKSKTEITNPYDDYLKTSLDVSKRSEYAFLHQANEFVDALGTRAYRAVQSVFGDAQKGIVTWEQANAQMEKYGIKGVYSNKEEFFAANVPRDRNIVREYVSKANAFLANTVLRLDFFNSIVNVVSTPMMLGTELASIRNLVKNDPILTGKLAELTSVAVPGGSGAAVPSTTKLIGQAIGNFFGPEKEMLLTRYKANGDVKDTLSQFHSMLDNLSMRADFKVFSDGVNSAFEKGAKLTLNEQAEQFTRFISADVMRQVSDPLVAAGTLSLKEQNAYISVFTNRVQGNYISSQRPIVFQGVLGSAVSLFQTYSFNLMQQLLRHVENKDKRAVATLFGMQAGTFGLNGTPFFEAVNTHLIGNSSINQGHYDAYSMAPALMGKEMGDWLMYGTASAFPAFGNNWPALYTRGDINPRHASILPLNPVDIPAIDAAVRVVKNLSDMGGKLVSGANVTETLLQGLEHNGINRPLAGFAQVLSGKSTTSKGGLISASNDFSAITSAARIMGAKPMDEAVALNNLYRVQSYKAADTERLEHLGERVKSYLYKNHFPPDAVMDGFMKDYARVGGRVENFNGAMQRWAKDANTSTVEKMRTKLKSSYGNRLNEIMGGVGLDDYQSAPPLQAEEQEPS